jgi:hypothetical protein
MVPMMTIVVTGAPTLPIREANAISASFPVLPRFVPPDIAPPCGIVVPANSAFTFPHSSILPPNIAFMPASTALVPLYLALLPVRVPARLTLRVVATNIAPFDIRPSSIAAVALLRALLRLAARAVLRVSAATSVAALGCMTVPLIVVIRIG